MGLADFIFDYAELKADYFNQSFESILNDSLLGLTVVTIGLGYMACNIACQRP